MGRWTRRAAALISLLLVVSGAPTCGGLNDGRVIARVGGADIAWSSLDHWMRLIAPGHVVPDPPRYTACIGRIEQAPARRVDETGALAACRRGYHAIEDHALGFLISLRWLIGEAHARGLVGSAEEVRRRLGEAGFAVAYETTRESLERRGASAADIGLVARAELASILLGEMVGRSVRVSNSEIASYYRRNERAYITPERRYFYIDNLRSRAAALAVERAVVGGRRLAGIAFYERLDRPQGTGGAASGVPPIDRAIFAARVGVLSGPIVLARYGDYSLFEVTRIVPAYRRPLASVRAAIVRHLTSVERQRELTEFTTGWQARWIARTSCSAGYVIDGCSEHVGPAQPKPLEPWLEELETRIRSLG